MFAAAFPITFKLPMAVDGNHMGKMCWLTTTIKNTKGILPMNNTRTYSNHLLTRHQFYHVTDDMAGTTTLPTSIITDIIMVYADIMHVSTKRASAILRKCQIRKDI